MATRNISLTDHFDRYIDEVIASGRYQNASEVVRDSLRLHEARERERQKKLVALEAAIAEAEEDIASGRYVVIQTDEELDAYFDAIWQEVEAEFADRDVTAGAHE